MEKLVLLTRENIEKLSSLLKGKEEYSEILAELESEYNCEFRASGDSAASTDLLCSRNACSYLEVVANEASSDYVGCYLSVLQVVHK